MTSDDQKVFVKDLLKAYEQEIIDAIDSHGIPEDWDGRELRQLIAEKAWRSRGFRYGMGGNAHSNEKRVTSYHRTVIVNNLN